MLIIGQKVKPNKIKLYRWAFDEIESFTLLKLTVEEAKSLIRADKKGWITENIHGVNQYTRDMLASTTGNTEIMSNAINEVWTSLALKHKEENSEFQDVSKTYLIKMPGTSCLIRDVNTHTIKIAYRKKNQKCGINLLNISDTIKEECFKDAFHSFFWKTHKKYGISIEDEEQYKKWSNYMNTCYIKLTAKI